jgi:hypothetical protein
MAGGGGLIGIRQGNTGGRYLGMGTKEDVAAGGVFFSQDGCCLYVRKGEVEPVVRGTGKATTNIGYRIKGILQPELKHTTLLHYRLLVEINPKLFLMGTCSYQHIVEPGDDDPLTLRLIGNDIDAGEIDKLDYIFKVYMFT